MARTLILVFNAFILGLYLSSAGFSLTKSLVLAFIYGLSMSILLTLSEREFLVKISRELDNEGFLRKVIDKTNQETEN